jgi:hypothetical protein
MLLFCPESIVLQTRIVQDLPHCAVKGFCYPNQSVYSRILLSSLDPTNKITVTVHDFRELLL